MTTEQMHTALVKESGLGQETDFATLVRVLVCDMKPPEWTEFAKALRVQLYAKNRDVFDATVEDSACAYLRSKGWNLETGMKQATIGIATTEKAA